MKYKTNNGLYQNVNWYKIYSKNKKTVLCTKPLDKAVSKWERDLSFPDVNSIPRLAEIFNVTVDEIMQVNADTKVNEKTGKISEIVDIAWKGIALAMGIAVVVLSVINEIGTKEAACMLGIGLACIAITQLSNKE